MKFIPTSRFGWIRRRHALGLALTHFKEAPWAGGVVLLVCVVLAMIIANLPWTKVLYAEFLEMELSIVFGSEGGPFYWVFPEGMTVEKFINDSLMVVFFFSVGLEIKREIVCGQLSSWRKALLPVVAAAGGMIAPAIIYTLCNHGTIAANGWGIPTATDIAFAVGILTMLGDRVPASLKIFLTALAIADDLGAILVIAFFYGGKLEATYLLLALLLMVIVYLINRSGEHRMLFYIAPAIVIWGLFYYSGVHSTLAGVAMAMLIPMEPRYSKEYFLHKGHVLQQKLLAVEHPDEDFPNRYHRYYLRRMRRLSANSVGMSYRLEHALSPYVTFLIMPVFALANAGVEIPSLRYFNILHFSEQTGFVGLGVFLGLVIGKPLGIAAASWLAVKSRLAVMPEKASWRMLAAVACLGGIGFTMSLFVDSLAFVNLADAAEQVDPKILVDYGKIAILMGSTTAAVLGSLLILCFSRRTAKIG